MANIKIENFFNSLRIVNLDRKKKDEGATKKMTNYDI